MRKRSKYRPKVQYANPLDSVLERLEPLSTRSDGYLPGLKAKVHSAMLALVRGQAATSDISTLIGAVNVSEGLFRMKGLGALHEDRITDGFNAIAALMQRHKEAGRVTVYAAEMEALNALLELHDAQLECITTGDMHEVLKFIVNEQRAGRTNRLISAALK